MFLLCSLSCFMLLLSSFPCVATCPIINPLLCFFAHCHVKTSSFSEGLCFIRPLLSSLCQLLQYLISTTTHMSLSNCRISPHHLILFDSKTFFSLFHFCCVHPDSLPPCFSSSTSSLFFSINIQFPLFSLPQLLLFYFSAFVSPPLFFCVRPYFVSHQYSIFFPFLSNFLCFDF